MTRHGRNCVSHLWHGVLAQNLWSCVSKTQCALRILSPQVFTIRFSAPEIEPFLHVLPLCAMLDPRPMPTVFAMLDTRYQPTNIISYYKLLETTGKHHKPLFKIGVSIENSKTINAVGNSKKDAGQKAATLFLKKLGL